MYLITRIRCNNILTWILLHLILVIRYTALWPRPHQTFRYISYSPGDDSSNNRTPGSWSTYLFRQSAERRRPDGYDRTSRLAVTPKYVWSFSNMWSSRYSSSISQVVNFLADYACKMHPSRSSRFSNDIVGYACVYIEPLYPEQVGNWGPPWRAQGDIYRIKIKRKQEIEAD